MFTVTVNSKGLNRVLKKMDALRLDGSPVWRSMGNTLKSITEGTFNSVGARFRPAPWKPKIDGSPSILQKSTTLVHSFHMQVTPRSATVSNATPYAAIHQFGGVIRAKPGKALRFTIGGKTVFRKSVRIPARPFFPIVNEVLTDAASDLIAKSGARAVKRLVDQAGVSPSAGLV